MSDKSSFLKMSIFDVDIVISPMNVKFSEDFCFLEFVNEIRDEGEGICIADCVFINIAVILTGVKTAILLFNEEEGGCLWRV